MGSQRRSGVRPFRLLLVLLVPGLVLFGVWQFSLTLPVETEGEPASIFTPVASPPKTPQLTTPLLSMRRNADIIVEQVTIKRQREATQARGAQLASLLGRDSCAVINDADGQPLFTHLKSVPMVPASNEKVFVAAAAYEEIDPDFQYTTSLYGAAPIDGVIDGPVRLVGGGDPLLSTSRYAADTGLASYSVATIDALVVQLVAAGVTQINGDIVGDDSRYDDERRNPTWPALITSFDVAPLSALVVNRGQDGAGSVPDDPAATAAQLLRGLLVGAGIEVTGGSRSIGPDEELGVFGASALVSTQSPPISTILEYMLQESDNLAAELILKEVGLQAGGGGTTAAGLDVVNRSIVDDVLDKTGVETGSLALVDGSGLSSENRLSCESLVGVLTNDEVGADVVEDLPVAGRSGTLEEYFADSPAAGRLRGKTGTLFGVKALSGAAPDATGTDVYFSVLINRDGAKEESVFVPIWDAAAAIIAAHGAPIAVDRSEFAPFPTPTIAATSNSGPDMTTSGNASATTEVPSTAAPTTSRSRRTNPHDE